MEKKIMYDFTYMHLDEALTHIIVYTDDTIELERLPNKFNEDAFFFRNNVSFRDVELLVSDCVFEKNQMESDRLLELLGLPYYDIFLVAKKTNGYMWDSHYWLRFADKPDLKWEDVKTQWDRYEG